MTLMSTSIMVATPEIARDLGTAPTAISTINAYVFLAMAASPLIWQPLAVFLGRRTTYLAGAVVLALGSLGCALADGTPALTAMWVLSGTTGPLFLVFGQTILSDIFEPVGLFSFSLFFFSLFFFSLAPFAPLFLFRLLPLMREREEKREKGGGGEVTSPHRKRNVVVNCTSLDRQGNSRGLLPREFCQRAIHR